MKLPEKLALTREEFELYTLDTGSRMKTVLEQVIFDGSTYEAAGTPLGVTKQAIYHQLKKIHMKKFGEKYAKLSHAEDNETD